jgi:hypothetical protein
MLAVWVPKRGAKEIDAVNVVKNFLGDLGN